MEETELDLENKDESESAEEEAEPVAEADTE